MTREEAYDQVADICREHALIHQADGGVIVVVHPVTQRAEGIEANCLYMAGLSPHPTTPVQPVQETSAPKTETQLGLFA